jgi:hypothetical protein
MQAALACCWWLEEMPALFSCLCSLRSAAGLAKLLRKLLAEVRLSCASMLWLPTMRRWQLQLLAAGVQPALVSGICAVFATHFIGQGPRAAVNECKAAEQLLMLFKLWCSGCRVRLCCVQLKDVLPSLRLFHGTPSGWVACVDCCELCCLWIATHLFDDITMAGYVTPTAQPEAVIRCLGICGLCTHTADRQTCDMKVLCFVQDKGQIGRKARAGDIAVAAAAFEKCVHQHTQELSGWSCILFSTASVIYTGSSMAALMHMRSSVMGLLYGP